MTTQECPLCALDESWIDLLYRLQHGDEEVEDALAREEDFCEECRCTLQSWTGGDE